MRLFWDMAWGLLRETSVLGSVKQLLIDTGIGFQWKGRGRGPTVNGSEDRDLHRLPDTPMFPLEPLDRCRAELG